MLLQVFYDSSVHSNHHIFQYLSEAAAVSGVVACTCNPATLEAEFWNGVRSTPVGV